MNILAIGNSFSQDATRYLYGVAKADNVDLHVVNLYFGGCSLEQHYFFMLGEKKEYALEQNGVDTGIKVSLKDALKLCSWDVITLQQVSTKSFNYSTYQPYLNKIVEYVKSYCSNAKIVIHQTWAYEKESDILLNSVNYKTPQLMLADIVTAYEQAKKDIGAVGIISSGEMFLKLLSNGIEKIHRDTFHASLGLGRYALALLWYRVLCNRSVKNNVFCDFDEDVSLQDMKIVKNQVEKFLPIL